jgi:hypothetical protein
MLALFLSLISIRCTEKTIISSQDALVDERFAPKILYSVPALNSSGPYESWGAYPSMSAKFYIRFNKLMDPFSVTRGIVLRSSRGKLHTSFEYISPFVMSEEFTLEPVDSVTGNNWSNYGLAWARLGEVLTLSVRQEVLDINGNALPPGDLGTFVPEPTFRARGTLPNGQYPARQRQTLRVYFNSPVDSTVFPYVSISPPVTLVWSSYLEDSTAIAAPLSDVPPGHYTLVVAAGAHDKNGNASSAAFTSDCWVVSGASTVASNSQ